MKTFYEMKADPYGESLSEINQHGTLKMCFVNKLDDGHIKGVHEFVKCRDFLNDVLYHTQTGDSIRRIYGFKSEAVADVDRTRLVLRVSEEIEYQRLRKNIKVLNQTLKENGWRVVKFSKVLSSDTDDNSFYKYVYTSGDPIWMTNPVLISFYTMLLRVCVNNDIVGEDFERFFYAAKLNGNDDNYKNSFIEAFPSFKKFKDIAKKVLNLSSFIESYEGTEDPEFIHDHGGVTTFANLIVDATNEGIHEDGDWLDEDWHRASPFEEYPTLCAAMDARYYL